MTNREIEKELNQIYKEMDAWPTANKKLNYKIPQKEVERREGLLYLQQTLYKIEDAKKERNKKGECFYLVLYYLAKSAAA